MRRLRILFLLCVSLGLLSACSGPSGFHRIAPAGNEVKPLQPVLQPGYRSLLYKARIKVYDRYFSGLFFFKRQPDQSHRIVFLSEFGLNLLDFAYQDNRFTVKNCQDFLNRETVLNTLKNDLGLLLQHPLKTAPPDYYQADKGLRRAVTFATADSDFIYFFNSKQQLERIQQDGGAFQGVQVTLSNYRDGYPGRLEFTHDWIELEITLELLTIKS